MMAGGGGGGGRGLGDPSLETSLGTSLESARPFCP